MPRPKKQDELESLKLQHAETAAKIARLEKERAARDAANAKLRAELVGAAVLKRYQGAELTALLRDVVLPSLKKTADRELFDGLLPAPETVPAAKKPPKAEPAKAPAAAE